MTAPAETSHRSRAPRLRFTWGGAKTVPGRWYLGLFGFFDRPGARQSGVAVSGRGLLAWAAVLLVAAYLAGATALWAIWSRNPYNLLTYGDALLYPLRRSAIAEKKGQQFIAEGMDLWRGHNEHAAASLLRLGLDRYPRDIKARAMLAQYYVLLNRRPLAETLLREGLTNDYPGRAYLQTLFGVAEQGEDYALIVELGERYRPRLQGDERARDRRWLRAKQFAALLATNRAADALVLANEEADWSDLAAEQRVMALLALHRDEEAVNVLAQWKAKPGADLNLVVRLQVRALREVKRFDEMERALEELRQLTPTLPTPVVYGIVQRAMAGQTEATRRGLEQYLARFGRSTEDLQLVAEPLLDVGELPLLERVAQAAAERGYPPQPFQAMLVQGYLQRGQWAAAGRVLREMKAPDAATPNAVAGQAWHAWMTALLDAATVPTDAAQRALVEFLRSRPWPMRIYKFTFEVLRTAGRLETERDAVELALVAFPASASLQQRKVEVAQALAAKPAPAAMLPAPAETPQWTESEFFARLDVLLRDASWAAADNLIGDLRKLQPPPPWVDRRDDRVRLAQVRIAQGQAHRPEMLTAARVYLTGDLERSRVLLELAREFHGKGDRAAGLALAEEVQRKTPNYPPVVRLLAEWTPKPTPKK